MREALAQVAGSVHHVCGEHDIVDAGSETLSNRILLNVQQRIFHIAAIGEGFACAVQERWRYIRKGIINIARQQRYHMRRCTTCTGTDFEQADWPCTTTRALDAGYQRADRLPDQGVVGARRRQCR